MTGLHNRDGVFTARYGMELRHKRGAFLKDCICMLTTRRIKNNEELDKLIKHGKIVNYIKSQRLSRFGHIQRILETRAAKKIFKRNPLTTRPRGRPKYRWEDIIQDFGQMKIKNWLTFVQDRAK